MYLIPISLYHSLFLERFLTNCKKTKTKITKCDRLSDWAIVLLNRKN